MKSTQQAEYALIRKLARQAILTRQLSPYDSRTELSAQLITAERQSTATTNGLKFSDQRGWLRRRIHRQIPLPLAVATGAVQHHPHISLWNATNPHFSRNCKRSLHAFQEDTPPPVTGADGRAPVVIGFAALKSLRENRPVRLSEI